MGVIEGDSDQGYCETTDVRRYFRVIEGDFGPDTDPTKSEVDEIILEMSDEIDRYTGHAWRERKVEDVYYDLDQTPYYFGSGTPIKLGKREIVTPLDSSEGDKVEIYEGDQYEDWVSDPSKEESRNGDYWVDETAGLLYIFRRWSTWSEPAVRVSYRYGNQENIPRDVKNACARLVAAELLMTDQYSDLLPAGNDGAPDAMSAAERLEDKAYEKLDRRKEVRSLGTT